MNDPRKTSAPKSHENLVKEARAFLNPELTPLQKTIEKYKSLPTDETGIENSCNFGRHNFNKKYLN